MNPMLDGSFRQRHIDHYNSVFYAGMVKPAFMLAVACSVGALCGWAQEASHPPRFEDFPVAGVYSDKPADPVLVTPEERRFRTVVRRGVIQGFGVEDGETGRELARPGPNFAGRYVIVQWGCGSPCLMAAIVDLTNGRVLPPPFHHGPGHSYFQVPWAFPNQPVLSYRLNSRLLVANICETDKVVRVHGQAGYEAQRCGVHYFVIGERGLKLIRRDAEPE